MWGWQPQDFLRSRRDNSSDTSKLWQIFHCHLQQTGIDRVERQLHVTYNIENLAEKVSIQAKQSFLSSPEIWLPSSKRIWASLFYTQLVRAQFETYFLLLFQPPFDIQSWYTSRRSHIVLAISLDGNNSARVQISPVFPIPFLVRVSSLTRKIWQDVSHYPWQKLVCMLSKNLSKVWFQRIPSPKTWTDIQEFLGN